MTYNGWKNYQTWNVAHWLGNDEAWYMAMVHYINENPGASYHAMIAEFEREHIIGLVTPDNVSWTDPTLDTERLDEMLLEHADDELTIRVGR